MSSPTSDTRGVSQCLQKDVAFLKVVPEAGNNGIVNRRKSKGTECSGNVLCTTYAIRDISPYLQNV